MNNRVALFGLLFSSALGVSTVAHAAPSPAVSHAPAKNSGVLVTISDGGKLLSSFTVKPGEVAEDMSHKTVGYIAQADVTNKNGKRSVTLTPGSVTSGVEYRSSISEPRNGAPILNISWNYSTVKLSEFTSDGATIQLPDINAQKGSLAVQQPFTGARKVGSVTVDFHKL